ncbi:hypothetical protein NMY22_g8012 [Coprinellus aureogranulatus]|nr:hypothetical protein NMY22_g8012 [Coprinellus aureogranulatus]
MNGRRPRYGVNGGLNLGSRFPAGRMGCCWLSYTTRHRTSPFQTPFISPRPKGVSFVKNKNLPSLTTSYFTSTPSSTAPYVRVPYATAADGPTQSCSLNRSISLPVIYSRITPPIGTPAGWAEADGPSRSVQPSRLVGEEMRPYRRLLAKFEAHGGPAPCPQSIPPAPRPLCFTFGRSPTFEHMSWSAATSPRTDRNYRRRTSVRRTPPCDGQEGWFNAVGGREGDWDGGDATITVLVFSTLRLA